MDRGIIQNFKIKFNQYKLTEIIKKIEKGVHTVAAFKEITLKDAIVYSDLAWGDVQAKTINNCFVHLKNTIVASELEEKNV